MSWCPADSLPLLAFVALACACGGGRHTTPTPDEPTASTSADTLQLARPETVAADDRPRIKQVALGDAHTCVLMGDNRVLCWGANDVGQLGDHTTTSRATPAVATITDDLGSRNLMSLTAGGNRTCIVAGDSRERLCWGDVPKGKIRDTFPFVELANNPESPQPLIRAVLGTRWVCGIREESETVCRPNFQRGDKTDVISPAGYAAEMSLAVGLRHACAARGGGVYCWGDNSRGQLGDGNRNSRYATKATQVRRVIDSSVVIAGDDHTCVVTGTHRELGCWGANADGQLGTPKGRDRASVLAVPSLEPVTTASAGGAHTCALVGGDDSQRLHCFGRWETGEVCSSKKIPPPTNDPTLVDLAASSNLCFVTKGGLVLCSGTRYRGPVTGRPPPKPGAFIPVPGVHGAVEITAGLDHVCARTKAGSVACWGENKKGQLGDGGQQSTNNPVWPPVSDVVQIDAGQSHTCARTQKGEVYCWGDNGWGQLGHRGTRYKSEPTAVEELAPAVELASGGDRTCVVENTGSVKCWGYGPLGDGTEDSSATPVDVRIKADLTDLELGDYHMCGRTQKGDVMCWGSNYMGELGLGNRRDASLPVKVPGVRNPAGLMTAVYRSCVIAANGKAQCTGTNVSGQLGDGTRKTRTRMTPVRAATQPTAKLDGGIRYTCAISQAGRAECWGQVPGLGDVGLKSRPLPDYRVHIEEYLQSIAGQPAQTTRTRCESKDPTLREVHSEPVAQFPNGSRVRLAAGRDHDCYIVDDTELYCWGRNDRGQLGDGTNDFRSRPQAIVLK